MIKLSRRQATDGAYAGASETLNNYATPGEGPGAGRNGGTEGFTIGVRHKLFIAFGAIASLTVIASMVGLGAFGKVETGFRNLSDNSIPAIRSAAKFAVDSNSLVLAAAELLNIDGTGATKNFDARLDRAAESVLRDADDVVRSTGADNVDPQLKINTEKLVENLRKLQRETAQKIAADNNKAQRLGQLFKLHETLASHFSPLADDAYFTLVTGGEEASTEGNKIVSNIVNKDVLLLRALLDARIEANILSSAMVAALMSDTVNEARVFEDRARSSARRLHMAVEKIASAKPDHGYAKAVMELASFVEGPDNLLTRFSTPGGRTARKTYSTKIFTVQKALDLALIEAIDDQAFTLAVEAEESTTKNGKLIQNLLDKEVTNLKSALELSAMLHQLVATLVQGALTDDRRLVVPIQDRVTAVSRQLKDAAKGVIPKTAESKFRELLSMGDPTTGVLAQRQTEFKVRDSAVATVKEMFVLATALGTTLDALIETQRSAVGADADAVGEMISFGRVLLFSLAFLSLLVAAAIGYFVVHRGLAKPLGATITDMTKLASGETDIDLVAVSRRDEIGEMARAVNVFNENAIARIRLEEEQNSEQEARYARQSRTESLIAEFRTAVADLLTSVSTNMEQMQGTAGVLTKIAEDTAERASQAVSVTSETSDSVQTAAASAEELNVSISEIGRQIGQTMKVTDEANKAAQSANEKISGLSEAAQKIGNVVSLIQGIAEQTNLLALNATIEAARAGDMGKGFAVVAGEVKALANQTGTATEEIAQQIRAIQETTDEAVEAIRLIGKTVEEVGGSTTSIAASVEQQSMATGEITKNIQRAADGSRHVAKGMTDVTRSASETTESAIQVEKVSIDASTRTGELRNLCDRFLEKVAAA